ncbi:MAG: ribosome assembly RNA-binding protein YhbY [Betaproteobacteria bacterium]
MPLTSADRRALKARAHALDPVVIVGNHGLTPAVLNEIDVSLSGHELIKVRVAGEDRETRELILSEICAATGAEAVQSIGRILVVYREKPAVAAKPARAKRKTARPLKRTFQNTP